MLDKFGGSFGASLRLLHITWGPPAEHAFHKTVANTFRNHHSKGLLGTSEGQMRDTLLAQWPVWGAHAPTGDPATEPFRLKLGRGAKRFEDIREHPDKTQRLNGV